VTDLLVQVELTKLAHELGVEVSELTRAAPLDTLTREELVELRAIVSQALFATHEHRFTRFASLARLVPVGLAAKSAEVALGPLVTAKVAAVTEPEVAVRMASHISPEFMARVSPHLDPAKISGILNGLPDDTIVDVGRRLVAAHEHIALGRFVSFVPVASSLQVVEKASPLELLQIALFTDEPAALDGVISELPDQRIVDVVLAAHENGTVDDAVTLFSALSPWTSARIVSLTGGLDVEVRDAMVRSIHRNGTWTQLVSVLDHVADDDARSLLEVAALQEPDVRAGFAAAAAGHPAAERLLSELS
jgi:hypothetical protein